MGIKMLLYRKIVLTYLNLIRIKRAISKSFSVMGVIILAGTSAGMSLSCSYAIAMSQNQAVEAAITAKSPDKDLLEAITWAGNRLVAVGERGIIIYSDDYGNTWHQAAVPVDVTLVTVAFVSPLEGWVGGAMGIILHTTDGGLTWKTEITGSQVNQLISTAANNFAASHSADPATPRAIRRANIFMEAGPDKPFFSILPYDTQNVQAFGAYRMCIKTEDGGKEWRDCSLDVPDPISHNLYDAVQSGSAVYVVGEGGSVFRSTDQGHTFSQLTAPADNTLFGLLVTPGHALLSFGVSGGLFRSTDQGQSWSTEAIDTLSDLTAGIILKSGAIMILSETGYVYVSTDDGMSFRALQNNEGMGLFDAIQIPNGDVLLVGTNGVRVLSLAMLG